MSRYSKSFFDNPYLKDGRRRESAELVMDEARQRWRVGSWRARSDAFNIDRKEIAAEAEPDSDAPKKKGDRPSASRFHLDVRRDLAGQAISLRSLRELEYSPTYRPKGNLDEIDEHAVAPMSTMVRYDVLAGELEAPPEDLSFLSDAQTRYDREVEKGSRRDGKLRRDTRRLDSGVDERRSALMRMLPEKESDEADRIIRETNRRKLAIDAELGRLPKEEPERKSRKKKGKRIEYDLTDPAEAIQARFEGSRYARLPEQAGMEDDVSRELPEFASETRYWSRVQSLEPTWSEVAEHTVSTVPQDEERPDSREAYYSSDSRYSRRSRYGDAGSPRERIRATEGVGEFSNEYLAPEQAARIREILSKKYRGRWLPPEFFGDDQLVREWFNQYNRGAITGEDFVTWACRQRNMAAAQRAGAPQGAVRVRPRPQAPARRAGHTDERGDRYYSRAESGRYEEARRRGYEEGRGLRDDRQSSAQRDPEPYPPYPADPYYGGQPGYDPYGGYPGYPPYGGYPPADPYGQPYPYAAPYGDPYGAPYADPYGCPPDPRASGYQGMYPDLFAGTDPRPRPKSRPDEPSDGRDPRGGRRG